jgi:hypothetical protein
VRHRLALHREIVGNPLCLRLKVLAAIEGEFGTERVGKEKDGLVILTVPQLYCLVPVVNLIGDSFTVGKEKSLLQLVLGRYIVRTEGIRKGVSATLGDDLLFIDVLYMIVSF